jgi:uncharacterized protein
MVDPRPAVGFPEELVLSDQWPFMSDVVNDRAHQRFELTIDGHPAVSYYKLDGNVVSFIHTEVPPELGGKGVGSRLVQGALDQIRAEGMKVIPVCPFVKAWIAGHPEYRDLVQT